MRLFNAFQATLLFALAPFGIAWLAKQEFAFHNAATIAASIIYALGFACITAVIYDHD